MRHAHLLEIRQLQLTVKNLVYKSGDFYIQNALKLTYEHLYFQKFRGFSRTPVKGGGEWSGREGKGCVRAVGDGCPLSYTLLKICLNTFHAMYCISLVQ